MDGYDEAARERWVAEPPKRVDAPERTPFERDRARVVHAAASRRLAAKTQVVGPDTDDFVRNRLTHSLEVAQVARDLARALGCEPDIAETAALAHDMGHPPFGHNGEQVLDELGQACGGFEGNAQTLRLLTRLEAKTFAPDGRSVGLNLTRATLDACSKYPWPRKGPEETKFGVYADDRPVFDWMRTGVEGFGTCFEAQVMDLADDIAYSVHDVEDGVVAGRIDLTRLDLDGLTDTVESWYLEGISRDRVEQALDRLRAVDGWPTSPYDGSRRHQAALKNLTSDLIGRFCGVAQAATFRHSDGPFRRHETQLSVPIDAAVEMGVLKGVAAHYVMRADDRVALMERQRDLLGELVEHLVATGDAHLEPAYADDWAHAPDDAARLRVVLDQVAALTDASAVSWHRRLVS